MDLINTYLNIRHENEDNNDNSDNNDNNSDNGIDENVNLSYITFMISDDFQISIQSGWSAETVNLAEAFGSLLYYIADENLSLQIIASLERGISEDPDARPFINAACQKWVAMKKDTSPVIKPSEVLNMSSNTVYNNSNNNNQ